MRKEQIKMPKKINVTIWNEEAGNQSAYPEGIHTVLEAFLQKDECVGTLRTALLDQPEHGLTQEVLDDTDVLVWWGHMYHHKVEDYVVDRVQQRVLNGMGLILLHSAHAAKIFGRLTGTATWKLRWREGDRERLWVIEHNHPITANLPEYIDIPESEVYGEHFDIPAPDELLFISWYEGGEVFRSGCTFKRGNGKIFFFSPGHEGYRIYDMPTIQAIITNAVHWAAPLSYPNIAFNHHPESPESQYKAQT
jgi:trehalose utilization protein